MSAGLILLAALALPAQEKTTPQTFTAGTELVLVDFVVSDKTDRLVGGLTAKDFVVKEDGKERPIVAFEAFGGGAPAASASSTAVPGAAPASSPSRMPQHGEASTVLLVDDGQLSPDQAAKLRPALKALLTRVGERSGTLMLVAPGSKVSVVGALPAGAANLAATVDRITGQQVEDRSAFPVADAEAFAIGRGDDAILAYQPPAHDKAGYRKIKVEVRTKGLNVRARRGYYSGVPASH